MKIRLNKNWLFLMFCLISILELSSQDSIPTFDTKPERNYLKNNGHWLIEVPIWIPGFRGEYAYGDIELEGEDGGNPEHPIENPGPGDIFKRIFGTNGSLNFFFMNRVAYENKKFYAQFDAFSGTVGSSLYFRYNNKELVRAKFNTNLFRLYGGFKFVDLWSEMKKTNFKVYAYGGIRVHDINAKAEINGINKTLKIDPTRVEPILGLRGDLAFKRWLFSLNGDVGNFYIDNNISYMINIHANYRLGNLVSIRAGWTDWDVKHKDKLLRDQLTLLIHLSGPSMAVSFHF